MTTQLNIGSPPKPQPPMTDAALGVPVLMTHAGLRLVPPEDPDEQLRIEGVEG